MSKVMIFALVAMMTVAVFAAPAEEQELSATEGSVRLPRATCDLLSGFGVGDSACAVHCIAMRYKGGWCDKGVCHCRH